MSRRFQLRASSCAASHERLGRAVSIATASPVSGSANRYRFVDTGPIAWTRYRIGALGPGGGALATGAAAGAEVAAAAAGALIGAVMAAAAGAATGAGSA